MKLVLSGHIDSIIRAAGSEHFTTEDDLVRVALDMTGAVEGEDHRNARATFSGTLKLRPKIANRLRFGEQLTITIEDDTDKVTELTDADIISIEANQ